MKKKKFSESQIITVLKEYSITAAEWACKYGIEKVHPIDYFNVDITPSAIF